MYHVFFVAYTVGLHILQFFFLRFGRPLSFFFDPDVQSSTKSLVCSQPVFETFWEQTVPWNEGSVTWKSCSNHLDSRQCFGEANWSSTGQAADKLSWQPCDIKNVMYTLYIYIIIYNTVCWEVHSSPVQLLLFKLVFWLRFSLKFHYITYNTYIYHLIVHKHGAWNRTTRSEARFFEHPFAAESNSVANFPFVLSAACPWSLRFQGFGREEFQLWHQALRPDFAKKPVWTHGKLTCSRKMDTTNLLFI